MPYTFRILFSGLCMYHVPDASRGARNRNRNFDSSVLLVNGTRSKLSIDGKTFLHRHEPTLTFDPGQLDDFNVRTDGLETDFTLIPRLGQESGPDLGRDHLAVVDLEEKQLYVETHPNDTRPFRFERETGRHPQRPQIDALENEPDEDDELAAGRNRRSDRRIDDQDLCWLPFMELVDRRVVGIKRQCFDDLVDNPYVTSRLRLDGGVLKTERFSEVQARRHCLQDQVEDEFQTIFAAYRDLLAGDTRQARKLLCEDLQHLDRKRRRLRHGKRTRDKTSRHSSHHGEERDFGDLAIWEFVPNRFPGRTSPYTSDPERKDPTPDPDPPQCFFPVRQALSDRLVLEFECLEHPIRLAWEDSPGRPGGFLTFPKNLRNTTEVEIHIANLPVIPDLPDTDVITHFRWYYECVDWKSGVPSDLPAPRLAGNAPRITGGNNGLCPGVGEC